MEENNNQEQNLNSVGNNKMIMIVALIIIIVAVAGGFLFMNNNKQKSVVENQITENKSTTELTNDSQKQQANVYKNGSYSAQGTYAYHSGSETIGVSVTLEKNVITDVSLELQAKHPVSKAKQQEFADNYKEFVIGKNIDEVNLGKIAGSSLTPIGFNEAIKKIKEQAKS